MTPAPSSSALSAVAPLPVGMPGADEPAYGPVAVPMPERVHPPLGRQIASRITDYRELFKVRVTALVVVSAWAGFYMASVLSGVSSLRPMLIAALLGIGLATAGSAALNECIERKYDAKMMRTANRPIAAGRIGLLHGTLLGVGAIVAGCLWLAMAANLAASLLTLATAFIYVVIYTPLKHRTTWATFIGAVPGAMGPVLGWAAVRGRIEWPTVALFTILFIWQFPHVMAVTWLYREDYGRAGIRMLPVVEPDGRSTAAEAIFYAALMIPVSLLPVFLHIDGAVYAAGAVVLGLAYLGFTLRFRGVTRARSARESDRYARDLFKASVIYLPLLLALLALNARKG